MTVQGSIAISGVTKRILNLIEETQDHIDKTTGNQEAISYLETIRRYVQDAKAEADSGY